MAPGPPKVMERVVGFFIPPACREEVLGDLCERYRSPAQYLLEALRTVPLVVVSRIRRTSEPRLLLAEAATLYISFLAAAWWLAGTPFFADTAWMRLAIPSAAALAALVLRDAWSDPGRRTPAVDSALAVTLAFLSQAALSVLDPSWLLPRWVLLGGAGMSLLLLSALRTGFHPGRQHLKEAGPAGGGSPLTPDEILRRSQELRKNARQRDLALLTCVLFISMLGWQPILGQPIADWLAGAVTLAAAGYVTWRVYRNNSARANAVTLDAYRAQLERQRDEHRTIWKWFVGPLLVSMLTFALRAALAQWQRQGQWALIIPFVALSLCWSFTMGKHSERAARRLQQEIDALDRAR